MNLYLFVYVIGLIQDLFDFIDMSNGLGVYKVYDVIFLKKIRLKLMLRKKGWFFVVK